GDLDLFIKGNAIYKIYRNNNGDFTQINYSLPNNSSYTVDSKATDFDGDGDMDIVLASANGEVRWVENSDGIGTLTPAQTVISGSSNELGVLEVADLDSDGD